MTALLNSPTQRFDTLFGAVRGVTPPERGQSGEQLTRVLDSDGLDGALRFYRTRRAELTSAGPLGHIGHILADLLLDESYAAQQHTLNAWLQAVGVRPHWSLNVAVSAWSAHIIADGHRYADSDELNGNQPVALALCGPVREHWSLLNRGAWHKATLSANPAMHSACRNCAPHAAEYPDCDSTSATDLLPASELHGVTTDWRSALHPQLMALYAAGAQPVALRAATKQHLPDSVAAWAAGKLAAHPRPNVLRALRSNGYRMDTSDPGTPNEAFVAQRLADAALSRADWRARLDSHRAGAATAQSWGKALIELASQV